MYQIKYFNTSELQQVPNLWILAERKKKRVAMFRQRTHKLKLNL